MWMVARARRGETLQHKKIRYRVKTGCKIKPTSTVVMCSDVFISSFSFQRKAHRDSLKIQQRSLKAYLLKNNLVPFIFVLCLSFLWPEMIALTNVASDLQFSLINVSIRHRRREERVTEITQLSIILCPSAERRLDIDPRLPSPSHHIWRPCHGLTRAS